MLAITNGWMIFLAFIGLFGFVGLLIVLRFFNIWVRAVASRAGVTLRDLIGMWLRKVDLRMIVDAKIQLVKSGLHEVTTENLESHYLAGGRVINVTRAMIAASRNR